jgi:hypothetical protein
MERQSVQAEALQDVSKLCSFRAAATHKHLPKCFTGRNGRIKQKQQQQEAAKKKTKLTTKQFMHTAVLDAI